MRAHVVSLWNWRETAKIPVLVLVLDACELVSASTALLVALLRAKHWSTLTAGGRPNKQTLLLRNISAMIIQFAVATTVGAPACATNELHRPVGQHIMCFQRTENVFHINLQCLIGIFNHLLLFPHFQIAPFDRNAVLQISLATGWQTTRLVEGIRIKRAELEYYNFEWITFDADVDAG